MPSPTKPDIDYSYVGFQQESQDNPFPGTQLDNDLATLVTSIDETIDALADVRRSDGALKNGIVTTDSLSPQVKLLVGADAGVAADVVVVAANIDSVVATADNMAAIVAAPAQAAAAASSAGAASTAATQVVAVAAEFGDLSAAMGDIDAAVTAASGSAESAAMNAGQTAADAVLTAADVVTTAANVALAEAAIGGVIYDTTAAGIAATGDGQFFIVKGDGVSTYALMYKNVATVATFVASYPDKAALDAISVNAIGGDNAGAPTLIQIGDGVVATVDPVTGQMRFMVPLHEDDLPPSDTLEIAETAPGAENAGADGIITYGDAVIAAVDKATGQLRFMVPLNEDDMPGASAGTSTAYADGSNYLVSPNEMWSQWVWPRTIEDDDGNQMWGSLGKSEGPLGANGTGLVGRPGPLWIGYREAYAASAKKVLIGYSEEGSGVWAARGKTDDHNRPAILRHPNPAAPIKLVSFQSDHSGLQWSRFWRSTTLNPEDLVLVGQTPTVPGDFHSYGQLWWNGASPNELRGCYRVGGFDTGVWSFFSCDPAGTMASWTHYFDKIGGEGTYFLTVPALDGDGTWLACVRHPTVTGAKKVTLAKLLWDWSLVAGDGTVISADIRAEVTPIDILDDADVTVIDTATGDRRLRLFDAREYADGLVRFLYADFPTVGLASLAGDYKIATYDPATDSTTIETVCSCGGKIQEEVSLNGEYVAGSGSSSYVAGACLTDRPTEIVAARWWGTYGDLVFCTRQGADDWDETLIDRTEGKIARPEGHARIYWESSAVREALTSRVSYWRGSGPRGGYAMFYNFNADRITIDLTALRSTFI